MTEPLFYTLRSTHAANFFRRGEWQAAHKAYWNVMESTSWTIKFLEDSGKFDKNGPELQRWYKRRTAVTKLWRSAWYRWTKQKIAANR